MPWMKIRLPCKLPQSSLYQEDHVIVKSSTAGMAAPALTLIVKKAFFLTFEVSKSVFPEKQGHKFAIPQLLVRKLRSYYYYFSKHYYVPQKWE